MAEYRIVVTGAGGTGKSAVTVRFIQGNFVEKYDCTIEDSYRKLVEIDGTACMLDIMDTAGQEEHSALRDAYMKTGQGFILCYSITSIRSFEAVRKIRTQILRIKEETPDIPIVLIGNKVHLEDERQVTTEQGMALANTIGAGFFEVSAVYSKDDLFKSVNSNYIGDLKIVFPKIVKSLNANKVKKQGTTLFFSTCKKGDKKIIDYFLEETNTDINYMDKYGNNALIHCALDGNIKTVEYLLDKGAIPIYKGSIHLIKWAFENKNYGLVVLLLKRPDMDIVNLKTIKKKMISEARKLSPIRVTILGAPESGKTTLTRLISGRINNISGFPLDNIATDGIEISKLGGYSFWDFGGQELLYSTHQFFLSEETQYILVVDLSLLISENEEKREKCKKDTCYWINLIKEWVISHTSPPVIIVGTHCDKLIQSKNIKQIDHAINELSSLINENNLRCSGIIYKISKVSKSQKSVKDILSKITELTDKYISTKRGFISGSEDNLNLQFTALRLLIENERETKQFIWWNEYVKLCKSVCIYEHEEITKSTKFLVNFGSILTYRHQSTSGISLIILDPEWLSKAFTSIISVSFQLSSMKRGFFSREALEEHWKKLDINEKTWSPLEKLFEMFNLFVRLKNNQYFVPIMLHSKKTSKSQSNEERLKIIDDKLVNCNSYGRIIKFSKLPFGLIDRLVVRILHYPGMDIDTNVTKVNDYFLFSDKYKIRIQSNYIENEVQIHLYISVSEKPKDLSFFAHFLFESPQSLLNSYVTLNSNIISSIVLQNNKEIGEEKGIIEEILNGKYLGNESPDLGLEGIQRVDTSNGKIIKKLAEGTFGIAWLGEINNQQVVFKELHNADLEHQKEFLREVLMMDLLQYNNLIKLIGISSISNSLLESSKEININKPLKSTGLLMVLEFAEYGDLSNCREILQHKNNLLKSKIALDIGIGLRDLHNSSGLPMIHRDVRSQNIFIFSLDEEKCYDKNHVHAKLADFGTVVIASPNYGEILGNWQYMAPESFQGALTVPYSQKIDVYSFGILVWEIFSNEIPFKKYLEPGRAEEGRCNILQGERPIIPNISSTLTSLIKKCWDNNPDNRPLFIDIVIELEEIYDYFLNKENEDD